MSMYGGQGLAQPDKVSGLFFPFALYISLKTDVMPVADPPCLAQM